VQDKPRGGNNPRRIDLDWLSKHLARFPDARAVDRIEDWVGQGGRPIGETAMYRAIWACGFTHKNNLAQ
jgi:hypothetical protein